MSDRTNHRRVLHFAVTGVLLGAVGCTGNEPPKGEAKPELEKGEAKPVEKKPEPELEFAPNPGPNERNGIPEVAPTTAVKEPTPVEPVEEDHVNEGPVKEPELAPKPVIEKRVDTRPVKEPEPEPKPLIKINPGPA